METINFKPSTKKENTFFMIIPFIFVIGVLCFTLFGYFTIGIVIFSIFSILGLIITFLLKIIKQSYSYEITSENEISISYKFINQNSATIRLDQITSLSLNQSFLEKILGLYSLRFGIFGKSNLLGGNGQIASNQAGFDSQELLTLKKSQAIEIYEHLSEEINGESREIVTKEKPEIFPSLLSTFFFISIPIIIFITILFLDIVLPLEYVTIISSITIGILLLFIVFIIIPKYLKIKSTKYVLTKNSVIYSFNYIFGSYKLLVPLDKITNTENRKNIFSYALFKVGHLKIFTGGSNDPVLNTFKKYEIFSKKVNEFSKKVRNQTENTTSSQNEKALMSVRPGSSYFTTLFFWLSVIYSLLMYGIYSVIGYFYQIFLGITIVYLLLLLLRFIIFKNTFYELYQDKIIDKSGIINIKTKEILFKKIKYIQIIRPFFFDRISNQGTIHLYTPGTNFVDNKLHSIDEYEVVFKELKEMIEEH